MISLSLIMVNKIKISKNLYTASFMTMRKDRDAF